MITRTEAERIAQSIHVVRRDWPVASIVTLIGNDLAHWSLLDVYTGLAHVAIEQNLDGSWVTHTPARVKENGPWHNRGSMHADAERAREREQREYTERKTAISARAQAIDDCARCDDRGYLGGYVCQHQAEDAYATAAARGAAAARAAIRPGPTPREQEQA